MKSYGVYPLREAINMSHVPSVVAFSLLIYCVRTNHGIRATTREAESRRRLRDIASWRRRRIGHGINLTTSSQLLQRSAPVYRHCCCCCCCCSIAAEKPTSSVTLQTPCNKCPATRGVHPPTAMTQPFPSPPLRSRPPYCG